MKWPLICSTPKGMIVLAIPCDIKYKLIIKPEFKIKKQKSGACQMTVKGDLTAQYSKDFKGQLQKCVEQGSNFDISLKDVSVLDVTALQLLQSVRNDLKSIEKILSITPPKNESVMELLRKCGLDQIVQVKL